MVKTPLAKCRADEILVERNLALSVKTDRLFAALLAFEWIAGIIFAFVLSPLTWAGGESAPHLHVSIAVGLGGLIAALPIYLVLQNPGARLNRLVIAVAQMLFSILLIHLTGGRIETHFHIFVSLAFLSAYRDWRPLVIATGVTVLDHFVRGAIWPESVYGVIAAGAQRAFEHAAWVLFEDAVLIYILRLSSRESLSIAETLATLELKSADLSKAHLELADLNSSLESKVTARTAELELSQKVIVQQQQNLISAGKLSALGEMAGGIAHEINNPLAIIGLRVERLQECLQENSVDPVEFAESLESIGHTVDRMAKIVTGLKFFAREGRRLPPQKIHLSVLVEDTLSFCRERFKNQGVELRVIQDRPFSTAEAEIQTVELSQVLLNLLNNAYDAIEHREIRWIEVRVVDGEKFVELRVLDSGPGIAIEAREKIMQPFFTTKPIGQGTGLGLSISQRIVEAHGGTLALDQSSVATCFVVRIPKQQAPYQPFVDPRSGAA